MVDTAVTEATFKIDTRFDGLDYTALNAMLNLYNSKGEIQFDADRAAVRAVDQAHRAQLLQIAANRCLGDVKPSANRADL